MDFDKLKEEIENDKSTKIPKWNGKKCRDGCNCVEIAEAKNNGEHVKNVACQYPYYEYLMDK